MNVTEEIIRLDREYVIPTYARAPMVVVKGQGVFVWDADGNEYLDFLGGIAVCSLGHCYPRVVQAIRDQAGRLLHCSNLYYIEPQARLARLLVENSAADRAFFCNSGTEAVEAALKLARKYGKAKRGPDCYKVIATENSFHGRTMGALAATGQTRYHKGYEPLVEGFIHVPFNDLTALRDAISEQVCAVIVEPIQGEGGIHVASAAYMKGLRDLCSEHDMLLVVDEVQCGIARTGRFLAHEHYGIEPDIICLAKGLGGGVPIGAVLAKGHVAGAWGPGDHGTTFGGNPLATATALAVVETILEGDLPRQADALGRYFAGRLEELKRHTLVKEIRGMGLMLGMELAIEGKEIVELCRRRGLLINCTNQTVLRFLPPLVVTEAHIDRAVEILDAVLAGIIS